MDPIRWLTTSQAAKALGVVPRTLYVFIDEGRLVAYRLGRVIRVKESDVLRFIEASRIKPGSLGIEPGTDFVAVYEDAVSAGNGVDHDDEELIG